MTSIAEVADQDPICPIVIRALAQWGETQILYATSDWWICIRMILSFPVVITLILSLVCGVRGAGLKARQSIFYRGRRNSSAMGGIVLIGPVNPNPGATDAFSKRIAVVERDQQPFPRTALLCSY